MELDKSTYNTMVLMGIENIINNNKQEYIRFCFNIYNGCDYFTDLTDKGIEVTVIFYNQYDFKFTMYHNKENYLTAKLLSEEKYTLKQRFEIKNCINIFLAMLNGFYKYSIE